MFDQIPVAVLRSLAHKTSCMSYTLNTGHVVAGLKMDHTGIHELLIPVFIRGVSSIIHLSWHNMSCVILENSMHTCMY